MRRRAWAAAALLAAALGSRAAENEIGFNERFALATNREEALAELIPGTEDYFFYRCLHAQNTGRLDEVVPLLKQWSKQLGEGERFGIVERRQALLNYGRDPQGTLGFLRQRLDLTFDHQREEADAATRHPTALDPAAIGFERFRQRALAGRSDLRQIEDTGLERLVGEPLERGQRRDLLQRLPRPDLPGLEALVLAELQEPESQGFGAFPIHRKLTLAQLDALRAALPALGGNEAFVDAYVRRLAPDADTDWRGDAAERGAYLNRLWSFAQTLPASQNSLKACVLYRLLDHERGQGTYDRARFMAYLQLPRLVPYARRQWLERGGVRETAADLNRDFRPATGLAPVGLDEPLVRDYLEHFLVDAEDAAVFQEWLDAEYLKTALAETKILYGRGDAAVWSARLDPGRLQALRERVELYFTPRNPEFLAADAEVALEAAIKHVPRLTIKVFDVDAAAYYREHGAEFDAGIDLDGLVPNAERTVEYADPPARRHVERLSFPELRKPGVYVVELVGNGVSSRALVRKGRLRFTQRPGAAGHVFTVFDEAGRTVRDAELWMAGQNYRAGEDGAIVVPFSTQGPNQQRVVVRQGRLACLGSFAHEPERYELRLGALLERENLLAGETATAVLRPLLLANGRPADLSLLQQPALEVRTEDVEGIASVQRREGLAFPDGADLVHAFQVPPRTVAVRLRLTAKVRNASQNRDEELAAETALDLNGILAGDRVADLLLRRAADGYVVEARGRNGEPLAGRAVNFSFKHRLFREQAHETLQTDAAGRIRLGPLPDITVVWVKGLGAAHTWRLSRAAGAALPAALHAAADETLVLPAAELDAARLREDVSLLAVAPGAEDQYVFDALDRARVAEGRLEIAGLAPGDYRLTLKRSGETVVLRVARAARAGTALVGAARILEATPARALQVAEIKPEGDALLVRLAHAGPETRVHVAARRTSAGGEMWAAYGEGVPAREPARAAWLRQPAQYVSGRAIGDEARYVLERRYAERFAGNMLERPSLLLTPWSRTATETLQQLAAAGEEWQPPAPAEAAGAAYGGRARQLRAAGAPRAEEATPALEFLPAPARVWANLKPDAQGAVRIPLAELGGRNEIVAVAADALDLAWRCAALAEAEWQPRDLRLARAFDPRQPLAERKTATGVPGGAAFAVEDLANARVEPYDTLGKVFRLFQALRPDETFAKFAFLTDWPKLPPERQRELYSEYACHEVNFFLYHKDRPFFDRAIRPHLANKRDKTFLDRWLLNADLSPYLEAGEFARLNTLERILLGQRLPAQRASVARWVANRYELMPPDPEAFDRRFRTAMQSGELEGADRGAAGRLGAEMEAPAATPAPATAAPLAAAPRPEKSDLVFFEKEARLKAPDEAPQAAARELNEVVEAKSVEAAEREQLRRDVARRSGARQLYRAPEQTREWVETHYYQVPLEQTGSELIPVNGFWNDYASHEEGTPFLSAHVDEAAGSLAERICALAVLDLPFEAGARREAREGARWTCTPATPAILYHQQIAAAAAAAEAAPLLTVENFFDPADRWRQAGAERVEKYVREEFVAGRVYGAQVVLTNPSSARRRVSALLQIPAGALPLARGLATRSLPLRLEPYATQTLEYFFYFPAPGEFQHFPATVSEGGRVVGRAEPLVCRVAAKATQADRSSWAYVSQRGAPEEVLAYLREQNVHRPDVELARIAWRMRDREFFRAALAALDERRAFDATLWSYALLHNDAPRVREYLRLARPEFARSCGLWLRSPLLDVDAEAWRDFEHKEYWPLVNARAHPLGPRRAIPNRAFYAQYNRWLDYLAYRPELGARERLAQVVCLLLQDRVGEALAWHARVKPEDVETRLQCDYLAAYLAFSQGRPAEARRIAAAYADWPVERWRDRFRNVTAQADEAEGAAARVSDPDRREQVQDQLAAEASTLALRAEGAKLELRARHLKSCELRCYPLDIELLFSRQPFLGEEGARLAYVRPALTQTVPLGAGEVVKTIEVPAEFRRRNALLEAAAEGLTARVSYTPHALNAQAAANYGQLRVRAAEGGAPVAGAYVKVYARFQDGEVRFYKDGYTDLRGAFDYAALSTDDLDRVERFALLVLDEKLGATILETPPPKR